MCREQSDEEDGVVEGEERPVEDATADDEVKFCLHRGSDIGPDRVSEGIKITTGAVGADVDTPDPEQSCRLSPPPPRGPYQNDP